MSKLQKILEDKFVWQNNVRHEGHLTTDDTLDAVADIKALMLELIGEDAPEADGVDHGINLEKAYLRKKVSEL